MRTSCLEGEAAQRQTGGGRGGEGGGQGEGGRGWTQGGRSCSQPAACWGQKTLKTSEPESPFLLREASWARTAGAGEKGWDRLQE